MTFTVGQKVVCIRHKWKQIWPGPDNPLPLPVYGQIYVVSGTATAFGLDFLVLQECGEDRFSATSFRPLVIRKTDISIFKKMLEPKLEDA